MLSNHVNKEFKEFKTLLSVLEDLSCILVFLSPCLLDIVSSLLYVIKEIIIRIFLHMQLAHPFI